MKYLIQSFLLAAGLSAIGGCDAVDYYPAHETPMRSADLRKEGVGTYGGNNSNYPVGTPGTAGTDGPTSGTAPSFNASGQGTFSNTGSYSGANVGGANTPLDRTTTGPGTAGGH